MIKNSCRTFFLNRYIRGFILMGILFFAAVPSSFPGERGYESAEITMNMNNVPLTQVLKIMSEQSGVNFTVSSDIDEVRITGQFNKVSTEEALTAISGANGLFFERVGKTDTVIIRRRSRSLPQTKTEIIQLNYIQIFDPEQSENEEETSNIQLIISSLLSEYGKLNIDLRTNSLVVTDLPEQVNYVKKVIAELDIKVHQIEIEVEMVEVSSDDVTKLGLDLAGPNGELLKYTGPSRQTLYPMNTKKLNNPVDFFKGVEASEGLEGGEEAITYGTLSMTDFTAVLKALRTKGKGKFLAKPKILTINNKKATINITADTAIGVIEEQDDETGDVKFFAERTETGITLEVTPQANNEGYISMLVEPTIIRPESSQFFPTLFVDPQTRSAKTRVIVADGSTLVIGGLVSDDDDKAIRTIPIIGQIPIIGWLFSGLDTQRSKKELLIFITPRIIESY